VLGGVGLIGLFKSKFEQHSGKVHEALDIEEASRLLPRILAGSGASRVVLAAMPQEYGSRIRMDLISEGFEVLELRGIKGREAVYMIDSADAGVTLAEYGVADVGAIAEVTEDDVDRLVSSLPRIHIALLRRDRIIGRFEESAQLIRRALMDRARCVVSFIGGPSRTGDIELRLVLGVHGPHQVHVVLFG